MGLLKNHNNNNNKGSEIHVSTTGLGLKQRGIYYRVYCGSCTEEQVGMVMCLRVARELDTLHHQLHVELSLGNQL